MAELSVDVLAEVELAVGPKTAAWLESIGWRPPVEVKVPMDLLVDGHACSHNEAGSPCDWNVCFQPEVPCKSVFDNGHGPRKCKRADGHKGIHSEGPEPDAWQWLDGDPYEVYPEEVQPTPAEVAALYKSIRDEISSPERLDELLHAFGIGLEDHA